jgi:predicted ATPase
MTNVEAGPFAFENLGPVREADVRLRPLSVFIGPNNAGKSYAALMIYALAQGLTGRVRRPFTLAESFEDALDRQLQRPEQRRPFESLSTTQRNAIADELETYRQLVEADVEEAIRRYFGSRETKEPVHSLADQSPMTVLAGETGGRDPFLTLKIGPAGKEMSWAPFDLAGTTVPMLPGTPLPPIESDRFGRDAISRQMWLQLLAGSGFPRGNTYYLPAARSGIMVGLEALVTTAMATVWRSAGTDAVVVPPFPGVVSDFLEILVAMRVSAAPLPRASGELKPVISLLEGHVLRGEIAVGREITDRLSLVYNADGVRLPITRASSMVAELAPLDLWLKHLVKPGDLIIIDEPEAHLHPEHQRLIARVLVRLVRAGVRVLCPTHSSLILNQISNHLLASQLSTLERTSLGYTDDDLLGLDDVAVYLFEPRSDGTHVEPVMIEPDWGISEDEFVRVSEAIGEETYRVATALDARLAGTS